ncbi:MAG: NAD-dependent epimerase/dehydratase family protein [Pseudomonadota bacterium]
MSNSGSGRLLIAGGGYSGGRAAALLLQAGVDVTLTRRPGSAAHASAATLPLNLDDTATALPAFDRVLYLVPPAAGSPEPRLTRLLEALPQAPRRLVLASTSGVYGDCGGALVDEHRPVAAGTERAHRRVEQERTLSAWAAARPVRTTVLRISGIYGPGRLPLQRLAAGEPVIREADAGPGNRIHVDDLAAVLVSALGAAAPEPVYNVADGNHASATHFYRRVAALAGLPPPREIGRDEARTEFSAMRYSFAAESRRLDTTRLRRDLRPEFLYDDLDSGIRASLAAGRDTRR